MFREPKTRIGKTAFVAAPLIGTIIFLASLLFVVNLSKFETSQVSYTVSNAYHNRIASLLEMYRSDMASVFSVGLSRSIEKFLLSQCWTSPPFGIKVNAQQWSTATEQQQRLQFCQQLNSLVQSSVCTINPLYGFRNWLTYLEEPVAFEGITFEPANLEQFRKLTDPTQPFTINCNLIQDAQACNSFHCTWNPGPPPSCSGSDRQVVAGGGSTACTALIDSDTFDCNAFARGELKCRDVDGKPLPGCQTGVFYVKVNVEEPAVYPSLPRVKASDGAGNTIRSGALSDQSFFVPINFPLYKYYDIAYEYVRAVLNEVREGYCIGDPEDCAGKGATKKLGALSARELYFQGGSSAGVVPLRPSTRPNHQPPHGGLAALENKNSDSEKSSLFTPALDAARDKAAAKLVTKSLLNSIQSVESQPRFRDLAIDVSYSTNLNDLLTRSTFVPSYNLQGADGDKLRQLLKSSFKEACATPTGGLAPCQQSDGSYKVGAYLSLLFLPTRVVDNSPIYRADPTRPNDFCFTPTWETTAQP